MRKKMLLIAAAMTLASAAALFGAAHDDSGAGRSAPTGDVRESAGRLLAGFSPGDSRSLVAQFEARVRANPRNAKDLTLLGLVYQQQSRETGDPSFYGPSEHALRHALSLDRRNYLTLTGLASLAASRHRFDEARAYARRALAVNPHSAAAWGILGDAEVETGRYGAAFRAFQRMVSLRPTASAYARISYAREILGRTGTAVAAMRRAVAAAATTSEPAAWARVQLANLFAETGRLAAAEREYRHALADLDSYAPALAGLARIEGWRGHRQSSVHLWAAALRAQAVPEYAVGLGDAYAALGRKRAAEAAYARADELEEAFARNGGRNQLETALFDLDHDRNVADALGRAREGWKLRPSVEGEHVLAWALYKNGRCKEARAHSKRALRLGTKDWGAMLHRGLIEACLGNEQAARVFREKALQVNRYALVAFGQPVA